MQKAFDQMKALLAADVLCAYPNHNKPFHIFTDASNYQLGACIMQDNTPVAYYSKKLNSAQMNFATIDKELLCVIATLREFLSMLLGAELHIHTDCKNILNVGDSSEQRLRWISYVDEYSPTLHYVEGLHNIIADAFSCLYLPGQCVLKKRWKTRKLDARTSGPYRVLQTHVNCTVTIELRPGVSERLNIQRVIPYKE
jgi:hypothetical protein